MASTTSWNPTNVPIHHTLYTTARQYQLFRQLGLQSRNIQMCEFILCVHSWFIYSFVLLFLFCIVFAVDPNGVFIFYGSSWVFLIESSEWTTRTYLLQLCFGWQGNRKFYWMLSNSLKCSIKLSKNLGSKYLWWLCHFFSFFKFQLMRILIVIRLPIHNGNLNHFSCVTIHSP